MPLFYEVSAFLTRRNERPKQRFCIEIRSAELAQELRHLVGRNDGGEISYCLI